MNHSGFAECHLGRDLATAIASTLAMLFEKFGKLRFCYAEM
jgi:hypothetical protein